jgi:hypothetical protein
LPKIVGTIVEMQQQNSKNAEAKKSKTYTPGKRKVPVINKVFYNPRMRRVITL